MLNQNTKRRSKNLKKNSEKKLECEINNLNMKPIAESQIREDFDTKSLHDNSVAPEFPFSVKAHQ